MWRRWCIWFTPINTTRSFCPKACTGVTARSCLGSTVGSVCWWVGWWLKQKANLSDGFWNSACVLLLLSHVCLNRSQKRWAVDQCLSCPHSLHQRLSLSSSRSLPLLSVKLSLLKWLSKTTVARHFPFNSELCCYNQIALAEILHWLTHYPQKIPLKIFHLILTDENPFSIVMWASFHFTPTKLQAALWYYWLGLWVFWSDQPHTDPQQPPLCCTQ